MASTEPGAGDAVTLVAAQADWAALSAAAGQGQLRMAPGAAERCAVACETLRDHLALRQLDVKGIGRLRGFGELDSARQLAGKFEGKADSGEKVLGHHVDLLQEMAATYRGAARAYQAQEQATATALRGHS